MSDDRGSRRILPGWLHSQCRLTGSGQSKADREAAMADTWCGGGAIPSTVGALGWCGGIWRHCSSGEGGQGQPVKGSRAATRRGRDRGRVAIGDRGRTKAQLDPIRSLGGLEMGSAGPVCWEERRWLAAAKGWNTRKTRQ